MPATSEFPKSAAYALPLDLLTRDRVASFFADAVSIMTGNKFRVRAKECFRAANFMADPERKVAHLDLAQRWLRLAVQIDKIDAAARCSAGTLAGDTDKTAASPPASRMALNLNTAGMRGSAHF